MRLQGSTSRHLDSRNAKQALLFSASFRDCIGLPGSRVCEHSHMHICGYLLCVGAGTRGA